MKSNTSIFEWSNGLFHNKNACQECFMKNNTFFVRLFWVVLML